MKIHYVIKERFSKMKKFLSLIFSAALIVSAAFCVPANASYDKEMEALGLYSDCLLLMSADNNEVIFEKNARKQTHPASLTKVITAAVVLENCDDMNAIVTVPEECIRELDGTGSSLGGLKAGEQLTLYDMLCCLLLQSANESATTLANYVAGGDRAKFIDMMNDLAERLGCYNSHFVNPHGLDDDDHYVTAEDMAKFMMYAMEFPAFNEIIARSSYTLPETNMQKSRTIHTTNFMLNSAYKDYYCKYVKGGKTGSTSVAGRCVVTTASKDGYNYIAVSLNSIFEDVDHDGVEENGAFLDTKKMYEWAFENIKLVSICDPDTVVGEVPVKYARSTDHLNLSPAETVYSLVPAGTDAGSLLIEPVKDTVPEFVKAPVKKGDVICKGKVLYAGETIKEIDLVAATALKRSIFAIIGTGLKSLFSSWIFRIIALAVIILLIVLIIKKKRSGPSSKGGDFRILNYNDFMKMR